MAVKLVKGSCNSATCKLAITGWWFARGGPSGWSFARSRPLLMIFCKRLVPLDDHMQETGPTGWSFAGGSPHWMMICKRLAPLDDHLQDTGHSGWSFAKDWFLWMIISKRPATPEDHLQEAGPSGWSSARGQHLQMINNNYNNPWDCPQASGGQNPCFGKSLYPRGGVFSIHPSSWQCIFTILIASRKKYITQGWPWQYYFCRSNAARATAYFGL